MFVQKNRQLIIFLIAFILLFSIVLHIIYNYGSSIPYYQNNITDVFINKDKPFLKNISIFNDLIISLIILIFIFVLIGKKFEKKISKHFQFVWLIKCFISFFFILIYENYSGLDQTTYFFATINDIKYMYHFGILDNFIDLNNSAVNFINILKSINFIFKDSWFVQKIFQNLLFIGTILFFYKTLVKLNYRFENNLLVFYLISFYPSFLFFSSFITKDFIIVFLISIIIYKTIKLLEEKNKRYFLYLFLVTFLIFIIFLLRWWIAYSLLLSLLFLLTQKVLFKIVKNKICLFLIIFLFFSSIIVFLYYSLFWWENSSNVLYSLFNRLTTEHFYQTENYNTLFINSGEKLEVLKLFPKAIFKFLFNPFLKELFTLKYFLFSIENIIIFILLFLSIFKIPNYSLEKISFLIILFLTISTVYFSVGYLNTGTTMRYSLQAKLPLLIVIIFFNCDLLCKLNNYFSVFFLKFKIIK